MKIAVGLIDRNHDRLPLANWTRNRIKNQTIQIDHFIDTGHIIPSSEDWDIVPRVKYIVDEAKKHNIDFLYLFENDDYYPLDYVERMEFARGDADFINSYYYVRYHIKDQLLQLVGHRKGKYLIGGLWTMGFRPEILDEYFWQRVEDNIRNLDSQISMFAQDSDIHDVWFNGHNGVAIKGHGHGLYKHTGPHDRFGLPYMEDPSLSLLSILTDQSFIKLHYQEDYKHYSKSNEDLRTELKNLFRLDESLHGEVNR